MKIQGQVLNVSREERELVNKEGVKRQAVIKHVLLLVQDDEGKAEVVNLRAYDVAWELPTIGETWETPRILKYVNYDGNVAEVMV